MPELNLYSTTPESVNADDPDGRHFRDRLHEDISAADRMGCAGMLVPQNMHEIDPWIVAGEIGARSDLLLPLVAVQPATLPPHTAASIAAAFAVLYGRPMLFNLVAGAREDEMAAVGDALDHDARYARLAAFALLTRTLLEGGTVEGDGTYYDYAGHKLEPCPDLLSECRFFVAGSSPASRAMAVGHADVVISHPAPVDDWEAKFVRPLAADGFTGELGIRIGILARQNRDQAWAEARDRFPQTWLGTQETKLKTLSTNSWSRDLATRALADDSDGADKTADPYWLGAFSSGAASAPFLVGSVEEVAGRLAEYVRRGVRHVVLNGHRPEDHVGIRAVAERTTRLVAAERIAGGRAGAPHGT